MNQDQKDVKLVESLKKHPKLFVRVEELLKVVENAGGDIKKAAEAELRFIEEVRQLGNEALSSWATVQAEKVSAEAKKMEGLRSTGEKNSIGTVPLG